MKHRILSLAACAALLLTLFPGPAAAASTADQVAAVQAMGILSGDSSGDLALHQNVTRAQFARMLTASSTYKDSVGGGAGYSLYRDVKSDHWASPYIKLAVEQGWMVGYVDGTFRPDATMTLEEACSALLKLLSYDSAALAGSFPTAQLSKARSLGLLDGVSATQGQILTRQDCAALFYNVMLSKTSAGSIYGTTMGYTVSGGELDYSSILAAATRGPLVAGAGGSVSLPFAESAATVYRNGVRSSLSAIRQYDVYYYHGGLKTVWAYSDRAAGTITALAPNTAAPTSVTVGGTSYAIGSSTAAWQLSAQGTFHEGDTVTLLLGMNGEVVQVLSAGESDTSYAGVVLSSSSEMVSGTARTALRVACTDGTTQTFYPDRAISRSAGDLVRVTVSADGTSVSSLDRTSLTGRVSADGTALGSRAFSSGVEIMDIDRYGGHTTIYPARLAGSTLADGDVVHYELDGDGKICRLILREVTGDSLRYGFLTEVSKNSSDTSMSLSGSYRYLMDGTTSSLNSSGVLYGADVGGALFGYDAAGQLQNIQNLTSISLGSVGDLSATAKGGSTYPLADQVQVVLRANGSYSATTLSAIRGGDYALTGWYDSIAPAGGRIRVIVAIAD